MNNASYIKCIGDEKAYVGDRILVKHNDHFMYYGCLESIDPCGMRTLTDDGKIVVSDYDDLEAVELIAPASHAGENYESTDELVSHPAHYQSKNGLEVIDVIEAFTADLMGIEATDTGNVIKYICRWKHKNGIQDLENAMWYLQHLINRVKEQ